MLTPIKIAELEVATNSELVGTNILAGTTDYAATAKEETLKFTFDQVVSEGIKSITTMDHMSYISVSSSLKVQGHEVLRKIDIGPVKTEGTEAKVEVQNVSGMSRLDFTFPEGQPGPDGDKGDKGEQGEKGDRGDQGIKGDRGDQGPQGDKGDKGDKGDPGADSTVQGPQGPAGNDGADSTIQIVSTTTGLPSDPASVVNVGSASDARLDFIIPKGEKGDKGEDGKTPTFSYDAGTKTLTITNA